MRAFTSRSDAAQSSSVSSIDTPLIHALPITRENLRTLYQKCNCSARAAKADHIPSEIPGTAIPLDGIVALETLLPLRNENCPLD
jgi:hypothetical protein